jgi:hypothetical protein
MRPSCCFKIELGNKSSFPHKKVSLLILP